MSELSKNVLNIDGGGAMFPFPSDWHEVTGSGVSESRISLQDLYDSGLDELSVGDTAKIIVFRVGSTSNNNKKTFLVISPLTIKRERTYYNVDAPIDQYQMTINYGIGSRYETQPTSGSTPSTTYINAGYADGGVDVWYYTNQVSYDDWV